MPIITVQPFSPQLLKALEANKDIADLLATLDIERLTPADEATVGHLNASVGSVIMDQPILSSEWDDQSTALDHFLEYGFPSDSRVIAAAILAGAAISDPGITLRGDLHPSVYEARKTYQYCLTNNIDPRSNNSQVLNLYPSIVTRGPDSNGSSIVTELADTFNSLVQGTAGGVAGPVLGLPIGTNTFSDRVGNLLKDSSKTLRVGYDLRTLDLNAVDAELQERFRGGFTGHAQRHPMGDDNREVRLSYAPASSTLRLTSSCCIEPLEDADEIFWVGYHYSVKNLQEVYEQVEAAARAGTLGELTLNIIWDVKAWKSDVFKGITAGTLLPLNTDMAGTAIYNGFSPWTASLICVEDDDCEYDAVSDTLDSVGDCAQIIAQVAGTVASVSGPTPMGVAAAAISSAAGFVDLCCDITEAIVDIANYFDEDDLIGFTSVTGCGDYAQDTLMYRPPITSRTQEFPPAYVGKRRQGRYEISAKEITTGLTSFQRTWRYRQFRAEGAQVKGEAFITGNSDDVSTTITLGSRGDKLMAAGVDYSGHGKDRHAEWKIGPHLAGNQAKGVVHWGTRAWHDIKYRPWVLVGTFTQPKDEQFSVN